MDDSALPDTQLNSDDEDYYEAGDSYPTVVQSLPRSQGQLVEPPSHAVVAADEASPTARQERVPLNETTDNSLGKNKMSAGSSRGGSLKTQSTQEFSQGHFERVTSPNVSKVQAVDPGARNERKATTNTPRTYATGQTGHINLHGTKTPQKNENKGFDQADDDGEDISDDDVDLSQTNLEASQFPEEKRFQAPKTPATRGKKRSYDGQILAASDPGSGPASTPRLPVNPFARTAPTNPGVMSLTQVFKATQAPSSPMLNVPTSDGLSDRPSPNMWNMQRPEMGSGSSPAKLSRTPLNRSRTEPHGAYVPMSASQEERRRRPSPPAQTSGSIPDTDSLFDNISGPGSGGARRYLPDERAGSRETRRRIMGQISAKVNDRKYSRKQFSPDKDGVRYSYGDDDKDQNEVNIISGSDSLKSSPFQTRQDLLQSPGGLQDRSKAVHSLGDEVQLGQELPVEELDLDGEETEHDASDEGGLEISRNHARGENDKENWEKSPVQVPRTVARKTRHILIQNVHNEDEHGLAPYYTDSQLVAVANSQPAEVPSQGDEPKTSPVLTNNSQIRVPDSTQVAPNTLKRARNPQNTLIRESSQQAEMSLVSSPSPQKGTPPESPARLVSGKPKPSIQADSRSKELPGASDDVITSPERAQPLDVGEISGEDAFHESTDGEDFGRNHSNATINSSVDLPENIPETVYKAAISERADHGSMHIDPAKITTGKIGTDSGSPQRSPSERRLRRPRKFADVVPQQSSQSQGLDFDINALTHDDKEFKKVVGGSPDSSPVKHSRKRIRRYESSNNGILSAGSKPLLQGVPPSSGAESSTNFNTAASRVISPHNPGHISTASSGRVSNQSEGEPNFIARDRRPIIDSTPDVDQRDLLRKEKPNDTNIAADQGNTLRRSKRGRSESSSRPMSRDEQNSFGRLESTEGRHVIEGAFAPNRIWAYFNGSPSGYYPATCLGPCDANRLRVRFDDGKEDTVPTASVRRLELKLGDVIKIDGGPGNRNHNTCVVQELLDQKQEARKPSEELNSVDVHGWSSLKLAIKKKDGQLEDLDQPVPISSIYLTKALFHSLRGRDYVPLNVVNDELGALSPSLCNSLPDTPASRKRRARAPNKKESSMLQSFKSSSARYGLFWGMAFVITSVDKSKRSELTSLIESNGGSLFTEGLDSIFDVPDEHLTQSSEDASATSFGLNAESSSFGFTALVAEKYSRTTNYLYALSLNVPCISICWIRDCVAQKSLLDWRHYLLPSGESLYLDGTVISRSMNVPAEYVLQKSSTQWPLKSMFDSRSRPMAGQNVLILSNASTQKTMGGHLFISYAMGAEKVCMAQGWKEANDYLQDGKTTWDWICAPDELNQSGRSRKRKSNTAEPSSDIEVGFKDGVKVVKPEFIVQSLVFGRLLAG